MQRALVMPRKSAERSPSRSGHAPAPAGRAHQAPTSALAFLAMVVLVLGAGISDPGLVLALAPALLLLALFTVGVRPGERLLERLRARAEKAKPVRAVSSPRPPLPLVVRPAGRSFATALAMRPPPFALAQQHG